MLAYPLPAPTCRTPDARPGPPDSSVGGGGQCYVALLYHAQANQQGAYTGRAKAVPREPWDETSN